MINSHNASMMINEWNLVTAQGEKWDSQVSLPVGTQVVAAADLDPVGADAKKGSHGYVFAETDEYLDGAGPMVRWVEGGMCNVYPGDVEVVWWPGKPCDRYDTQTHNQEERV